MKNRNRLAGEMVYSYFSFFTFHLSFPHSLSGRNKLDNSRTVGHEVPLFKTNIPLYYS